MTQLLVFIVLFIGLLALLPWAVRWLQRRAVLGVPAGSPSRVVAALAVGPQQRVVTVEVGPPQGRVWLVLGVTAQQMTCLHRMPVGGDPDSFDADAPAAEEVA